MLFSLAGCHEVTVAKYISQYMYYIIYIMPIISMLKLYVIYIYIYLFIFFY
jgi:hypothetical protein